MTHLKNTTELPPALAADRTRFTLRSGIGVSYYSGGIEGAKPLVLLHSINAAPSAIEMKPLFDHYKDSHRVYAPEMPGFGASDRPDTQYSADFFADALIEWMNELVPTGADVIALSLTSEFAARAALKSPELFHSLTLISPSGMSNRQPPTEQSSERIKRFLDGKLFGPAIYRLLTSRASIRYFLNKAFIGKIPPELIDYAFLTSHRPGAIHAPFAFLSLALFTRDATDTLYLPLQQPAMVIYDTDPNVSFERLDEIVNRGVNWQACRIKPTLGMPHFERAEEVIQNLDRFWGENEAASPDPSQA